MILLVAACTPGTRTTPTDDLPLATEPVLTQVDPDIPLARLLTFDTESPSEATVSWSDGGLVGGLEVPSATHHDVPILRMRPDRDVVVAIEVRSDGRRAARTLTFHTDPLPARFADITLHVLDEAAVEPGDTLFGAVSRDLSAFQVVVDPEGEVVWWWERSPRLLELQLRSDGLLLGNEDEGGLVSMDWLGRVRRHWAPEGRAETGDVPVDVALFHHDLQRLPDGTLVAMSATTVSVDDFPVSYDDPTVRQDDAHVRDDEIVLIDPDSGAVERRIPYSTAIPYERIGYTSLVGSPAYDWVHGNGVAVSPDHEGLVFSSRAQDALVGVDLDGTLRWILANPANWPAEYEAQRLQPVGSPFAWPYKQHAPEWFDGDRIMMFDNGNRRASPWTGETDLGALEAWSRVVEYAVDEQAGTVRQAWEFQIPGHRVFGDYMGDADHLPNGDVLGNFAGIIAIDGQPLSAYGLGRHMIRLVEFVPGTSEVVWDLELSSEGAESDGWNSYRSQRLPPGWEVGAVSDLP